MARAWLLSLAIAIALPQRRRSLLDPARTVVRDRTGASVELAVGAGGVAPTQRVAAFRALPEFFAAGTTRAMAGVMHVAAAALAFLLAASALAQCDLVPTATGRGVPSLDGPGRQLVEWDLDGAGPLGPRLIFGGSFQLAGNQPAKNVAAFDPATGQWSALDAPEGVLLSLAALPNGLLLAGGDFVSPIATGSVLQFWTGSAWSAAIPQPVGLAVVAMAVAPTGELFAACADGGGMNVQRFGSSGWQVFGTAATLIPALAPEVRAFAFDGNGDLLMGGQFQSVNGVAAANLARWNGSTWAPIGSGVAGKIHSLLVTSGGALLAGGLFPVGTPPQGANVAQWNGTSWQALGSGTQSTVVPFFGGVYALAEMAGELVAAGAFDLADGGPAFKVARWNGAAWTPMGSGIEQGGAFGVPSAVFVLQRTANGELFAAGDFRTVGGRDGVGLARWNGSSWTPVQPMGIGNGTTAVHRTASGDVYLGGTFRDIDGVVCNGIARRVGNGWQPLGSGILDNTGTGALVSRICSLPSGELVVGGGFPAAGGVPAAALAAWNGTSWSALGTGLANTSGSPPSVQALHATDNGDLYVAGSFDLAGGVAVESVARWDGSQWSAIGNGLGPAFLFAVTAGPTGEVYVAGGLSLGGLFQPDQIAVGSGGSWQAIGLADGPVFELLVLPNGDLLAGGTFQSVNGQPVGCVARWSGGVWTSFGGLGTNSPLSSVRRLQTLPGGDVLAAGVFDTGTGLAGLARWNGSSWSLLANELFNPLDLAVDPSGEVLVAGSFSVVGGAASANLARLVAPCAATAIAAGGGCVGSGGLNQLATSGLPWLGEILVATASGMPSNGVAMTVLGLGTANVPLSSLLPQGGAGCALLVTPDVLGFTVPTGGFALVPLPLPLVPSLAGATLQLQVAPVEFSAGGAITAVTSSNRLSLTLGIF